MKRKIIALVLVVILVFIVVYTMITRNSSSNKISELVISTDNYEEIISAIGYVDYEKEMIVRSQVSGKINSINKEVSERVNKNEQMISINDKDAKLIYVDIENSLKLAEARLLDYKNSYNNTYDSIIKQRQVYDEERKSILLSLSQLEEDINKTGELVKKGVSTETELRILLNQKEILNQSIKTIDVKKEELKLPLYVDNELIASIDSAKEKLKKQEEELKKYNIQSEISGIIIDSYVKEGELVQAGQDLFKIASDDKKYVIVNIDEKYLSNIMVGKEVQINSPQNSGNKIKGLIAAIAPSIDIDTGTIEIKVEILENKDIFIKNMTAQVDFSAVSFDNVIVIPGDFVVKDNGVYVFSKDKEEKMVKKPIEVYNQNLSNVYVTKGLLVNDVIYNPQEVTKKDNIPFESEETP